MRKLFSIGLNDGGFFVFPFNSPPQYRDQATGNEVSLQQAADLCDALNQSVSTYIADLGKDAPVELLKIIAKHWTWRAILEFIGDLVWQGYLDREDDFTLGAAYKNSLALYRLVQSWL